ncbi:MAG: trypsin-like peptidase domain-containing protein [Dehalococcoidia bacterium]
MIVVAFALAACRSGGGDTEASGAVTTLEGVRSAVIRIVAEGTFLDPEFGEQLNAAGSGSGFIISASGLAVTNNHVVTGAGLVRVFLDGSDRPLNARLLGASECSDLALVDLEGDGYPFLTLREGAINAGLDAYAAGFPLGDPEYTLTRGIISKARADGESEWASVDFVVEHDAQLNPGSSGGPLVDANGEVIGINYAGSDLTNQSFAIGLSELRRIIDRLSAGEYVTSIGINGQAITTGDVSGIWVASVRSGSPADRAGIRAGDVLTRLEGLALAVDGTMSDYCDILRSHGSDDVLAFELLRSASGQVLEGRLNGDTALSESFSFVERLGGSLSGSDAGGYTEFVSVTDDSGVLVVEVPADWTDLDGTPWFTDEPFAPSITVAADLDGFLNSWTEPGLFFGVSEELATLTGVAGVLDQVRGIIGLDEACDFVGRFPYSDSFYSGQFDQFEGCGGEDVIYISLAALPEDGRFIISVQVQLHARQDASVLDSVLDSFIVLSGPPVTPTRTPTPTPPTPTPTPTPPTATPTPTPTSYYEVTDDSGSLLVDVPVGWSELESQSSDGPLARALTVSADLASFSERPTVPGLIFGVIVPDPGEPPRGVAELLDELAESLIEEGCNFVARVPYSDPFYDGQYDRFEGCGGEDVIAISLVALPDDESFVLMVTVVLSAQGDPGILDRILGSFVVIEAPTAPSTYREVTDDSGSLVVDVPVGWTEVDGSPWFTDEPFAPSITVSADLVAFRETPSEPGLFFGASEDLAALFTVEEWLDRVAVIALEAGCDSAERVGYDDGLYAGQFDRFEGCGDEDAVIISLAALPGHGGFLIWLMVQLGAQQDAALLTTVLDSFIVLD